MEWVHEAGDYTDPIEGEKCRWKDGKWNAEKKKRRKWNEKEEDSRS